MLGVKIKQKLSIFKPLIHPPQLSLPELLYWRESLDQRYPSSPWEGKYKSYHIITSRGPVVLCLWSRWVDREAPHRRLFQTQLQCRSKNHLHIDRGIVSIVSFSFQTHFQTGNTWHKKFFGLARQIWCACKGRIGNCLKTGLKYVCWHSVVMSDRSFDHCMKCMMRLLNF